jgi:hypothetical protein
MFVLAIPSANPVARLRRQMRGDRDSRDDAPPGGFLAGLNVLGEAVQRVDVNPADSGGAFLLALDLRFRQLLEP